MALTPSWRLESPIVLRPLRVINMPSAIPLPSQRARSLCVVTPCEPAPTETFIRAHIEELPAKVVLVHGWRPSIGNRPILSAPRLGAYKVWRTLAHAGLGTETTAAYLRA